MKKILFLVSKKGLNKELVNYFNLNFRGKIKVIGRPFTNLVIQIRPGAVEIKIGQHLLENFDLVYLRKCGQKYLSLGGTITQYLEKRKIPYFDSTFAEVGPAGDKLTSLVKLALKNFPVIPTYYCDFTVVEKHLTEIRRKFGFPIVAKETRKQYSKGIFVLRRKGDLNLLPEGQYLFQPLLSLESEYRLLVLGDEVVSVQKMTRDLSGFKAKIDFSRKEEFLPLNSVPTQVKKMAVKSAKTLDIQIAGVDVLVDRKGDWYFLEVNRGPAFTPHPKISPELPEVAKYFKERLNGRRNQN